MQGRPARTDWVCPQSLQIRMQVNIVTADGAMSMSMTVEINGMTSTMIWKDGVLYCDEDGEKVKCETDWEHALPVVGSAPIEMPMVPSAGEGLSVSDLFISLSAEQAEDGSVTVTAKGLNTKAYAQLLADPEFADWMEEMGFVTPSFDDEGNLLEVPEEELRAALEQFTEENMVITYTLDEAGQLVAQTCKLGMSTSEEDEVTGSYAMALSLDLAVSYTYGGQTVTAPAADDTSWTEVTIEDIIGLGEDVSFE